MQTASNRFKMIASSYLFAIQDGKILLSRRKNTGYEDGNYSLPAGHVEDNETLKEAASREAREEIAVDIKPEDFTLAHIMHRKKDDIRVDFFFKASLSNQTPQNNEPDRCGDLSWFSLTDLPSNTVPYIRHAIECYQKNVFYSEFGWE